MSDEIINDVISLPDIPLPVESNEPAGVDDTFNSSFKFCFIGAGQGGSRIAQTFYELGYRRVCVVNSTRADSDPINIPKENKLTIDNRGAGKDLETGKKYAISAKEDILDLMRRSFNTSFDRIMVSVGAGGGTGAGSVEVLIDAAREWAESCDVATKSGPPKVGVIVALPQNNEGNKPSRNAYIVLKRLVELADKKIISPLIIVDNQRIQAIYPNTAVTAFWNTANKSICSLFHLFNLLASQESSLTTFDKKDYEDLLESGIVSFGATPLPSNPKNATDMSAAIRSNLNNNILSGGFDLKTGKKAGCVVVGSDVLLSEIPQNYLDHGFEMLTRMLSDGSTVHRGIYKGDKQNIAVYTLIAGLGSPVIRLNELKSTGGMVDFDE